MKDMQDKDKDKPKRFYKTVEDQRPNEMLQTLLPRQAHLYWNLNHLPHLHHHFRSNILCRNQNLNKTYLATLMKNPLMYKGLYMYLWIVPNLV